MEANPTRRITLGENERGEPTLSVKRGEIEVPPLSSEIFLAAVHAANREAIERGSLILHTFDGEKVCLLSSVEGRLTAVTSDLPPAEFRPEQIPIRCAHPLISDPFPCRNGRINITAVGVDGRCYAAFFPETAGDLARIGEADEISENPIFPHGCTILSVFARSETELILSAVLSKDAVSDPIAESAAALACAVANGICPIGRSVTIRQKKQTLRGVSRANRTLSVTCPIERAAESAPF